MDEKTENSWENFLNPKTLRENIIIASVFSITYEILKQSIIARIKDFFLIGFDENGYTYSESYKEKVLSLNKNPLNASLAWLQNMNAIDATDITKFNDIRQCRNTLVHEMSAFVSSTVAPDIAGNFAKALELVEKIEKWWIANVELEIDPDINVEGTNLDHIMPGPLLTIKMLTEVALGSEEESAKYYEFFTQNIKSTKE